MKTTHFRKALIAAVAAAPLTAAFATNGMNMEGYGPIATGMGGASQATDNGTAGMAQNPATLSLMGDGARLDAALGVLQPTVSASYTGMGSADSDAKSFMMPALGYTRRSGALVYGVGMMAQGGMGTEYGANTFMAMGTGDTVRSELGVGNLIVPVAYQVNSNLSVGGSFDFVWATMDLKMAIPAPMMAPAPNGLVTGMSTGMAGALPPAGSFDAARVDFSDSSKYSGAAKANGYRAKIGATYKVSNTLTVGGSYQGKTSLSDMQTADGSAAMSFYSAGASLGPAATGKITVQNFQWPSMTSLGAAWQASPALLVAADVKSIGWADVMKSFNMRFDMGGEWATFSMPQNWKDQTVVSIGGAYQATSQLTLRAGMNIADNPIPESYVNALFPATIKTHYTLGAGYDLSKAGSVQLSYVIAPKVETVTPDAMGGSTTVSHAQSNLQVMYSHRF